MSECMGQKLKSALRISLRKQRQSFWIANFEVESWLMRMFGQIICNLGCKNMQQSLDLSYLRSFLLLQKFFFLSFLLFPLKKVTGLACSSKQFSGSALWQTALTMLTCENKGYFYNAHKLCAFKTLKVQSSLMILKQSRMEFCLFFILALQKVFFF